MKLEKNRNFEALVSDTFRYVGNVWEHFLPTMLRVNIVYLAAVFFMTYFAITHNYGAIDLMPSIAGGSSFPKLHMSDIDMHVALSAWEIIAFIALYILFVIGFIIFEAFTPTYMILQNKLGRVPTYDEIVSFMKERTGRIVLFCVWSILMFIPLCVIIVIGCLLLIVSIIGIVLIPLFILMISIVGSLLLFAYLENDKIGFFDALDIAWKRLTSHFFRYLGSAMVIYIICAIIMFIPQSILFHAFSAASSSVFLGIMFALLSLLLHFIISAFYNVNMGLIYFSSNALNNDYIKNTPAK